MPNPQIDQFAQSLFWKLAPWIILCAAFGTFAGVFVKWLERRATRFGQDWRSRREAERRQEGRRSQTAATGLEVPHCPICSAQMVKRTVRRGAKVGSEFWGCPDYPRCRGTRDF